MSPITTILRPPVPTSTCLKLSRAECIASGDELFYDYGLVMDEKITRKLRQEYRCLCGAKACRGTMLALPKKNKLKKAEGKKPESEKSDGKGSGKKKPDGKKSGKKKK